MTVMNTSNAAARVAAMLAALLTGLAGLAAHADRPPPPEDPIVVPDTAVEVDRINLLGKRRQSWTPLNKRMLLLELGSKRHLLVFERPCAHLDEDDAVIYSRSGSGTTLFAGADSIYVDTSVRDMPTGAMSDLIGRTGIPCRIDRIYEILKEDADALRKQFRH